MAEIDSPKHEKFVYLKLHFCKIPMDSASVALRCNTTTRIIINTHVFIQLKRVWQQNKMFQDYSELLDNFTLLALKTAEKLFVPSVHQYVVS